MREEEKRRSRDGRPTPARLGMADAGPQRSERGADDRRVFDPVGGQEWVARVWGKSASGVIPLRIISLLEVGFFKSPESGVPERAALCQGESLDDLDEEELLRLFRMSRPFTPPALDSPAGGRTGRRKRPG